MSFQIRVLTALLSIVTSSAVVGAEGLTESENRSLTTFANRLFQVANHDQKSNLILAPSSLFECLAVLETGAKGETEAAIRDALGLRMNSAEIPRLIRKLHESGAPAAYQFDVLVRDNDGYGVKVVEDPAEQSATYGAGIQAGDLIFTVNGAPVQKAGAFIEACRKSNGHVSLSGFSRNSGEPFQNVDVPLKRRRLLSAPRQQWMARSATAFLIDRTAGNVSGFAESLEANFSIKTFSIDFKSLEKAEPLVADYFSERLGRLTELSKLSGQIPAATAFLLVNVASLDAQWARRFSTEDVKTGSFLTPDQEIRIPFMNLTAAFVTWEDDDASFIQLPYRDTDLSMYIVLPRQRDGWKAFTKDSRVSLTSRFQSRPNQPKMVDLQLPRFRVSHQGSLKDLLLALGLEKPFDNSADFSGIQERNRLRLEDIRQQAFIEVNETGTKAGAKTEIIGVTKSVKNPNVVPFQVRHPFFVVICGDDQVPLFMARVLHPEQTKSSEEHR